MNQESVGAGDAMIHMDRFQLDLSKTDIVPGSESLEFYSFKVVLEASRTHLRQRLQN